MKQSHNPFDRIPEFFANECHRLGLPLETVTSDTAGFVAAILAIPEEIPRIQMRRYMELTCGFNYLRCYLQTLGGLSPDDAGRVANTVLLGVREAGIPLSYRDNQK